jgi:hypothetical protein
VHVRRDEERVVHESSRRDLEVHRADADTLPAQAFELVRRTLVEWHDLPIAQDIKELSQTGVGRNLPIHVVPPVDDGQPSAKHFLHAHDGASHRLRRCFHAAGQ